MRLQHFQPGICAGTKKLVLGQGSALLAGLGVMDFGALAVMGDSASSLGGNLLNSERAEGCQDVSAPGLEQNMLWEYRKYSNIL